MRRSRPLLTLTALASLLLALLVPGSAHAATPRGTEVTKTFAAAPAWQPWTAYATGAHVTYNGTEYECIQGHTSQPGWEPPNVPALWKPATGTPGDTTKPSVPAGLRSPAQGNTTIDLAWNASTDNSGSIKEYRVYEGTTLVRTSTTTSTQVTGLSPNTSHTYTVTAVDPSNNESDKSAPVTATTTNTGGDTTKPTVPANLRSPAQSTITIDLAWDASTDNSGSIKEYRVYEGTTLVRTSTTTSTQVTGLNPNTSHTYTVTAVDPSNNESAKSAPVTASTKPDTGGGTYNKVGYFVQWGIYGRGYLVKNLDTTGAAAKLTHLNYAFSNVNPSSLTCMNGVDKATSPNPQDPNQGDGAGDAWADYGKGFSAGESVDGQADAWDAKLAGNFGQLKKLKAKYPNLRTLISVGGWTYSKYFSDLASTDARRKAFVKSCLDMYIKGDLPAYSGRGGPGAAAGVFDGIDVDWEWPGAEGHPGNHVSPNDKANLTLLLQEFRTQLDALGATTGKHYLLTAFTPADPVKIDAGWDLSKIFSSLDFANAQGYDFHGAGSDNSWEPNRTGHQGNLYLDTDSPYNPDFSVDKAVQKYLDAGVNPRKLTIGLAYYGRGWQQVTDGGKFGEWQDAHGAAPGQFQEEAGTRGYSNLLASVPNCTIRHDEQSIATYCFTGNGGQWWSFDDPWSIGKKTAYIKAKGLLGAMIWEMSGDPGVLTTALDSGLR